VPEEEGEGPQKVPQKGPGVALSSQPSRFASIGRRARAGAISFAIATSVAAFSACDNDEAEKALDDAQEEIDKAEEELDRAGEQAGGEIEKKTDEAQDQLDEAQKTIEEETKGGY
jgi:hypothetical protein